VSVPDSPSLVEVGGGFMQIIEGFLQGVGVFGLGLLLVLLVLAVKAAPLIALLSAVASALPPARRPRRRTGLAYLFAVAALLLAYLWLPAPPSLVHPTLGSVLPFLAVATVILAACRTSWDLVHPELPAPTAGKVIRSPSLAAGKVITLPDGGDGEDPDGHARIVATLPPAIAADFYDHLVCCDPNRARCGHDVTDSKWADPDDPGWGPTCPDCATLEDDDCPACTIGATTPDSWVTRDETGATP
jgi:hypothetical protein